MQEENSGEILAMKPVANIAHRRARWRYGARDAIDSEYGENADNN